VIRKQLVSSTFRVPFVGGCECQNACSAVAQLW